MAYAAYSESGNAHVALHLPCQLPHFVVLAVTVPSLQALRVRRALARCPGAGILRCVPQPVDHLARLEVHLPNAMVAAVMQCVRGCVDDSRFGPVRSWTEHMAHHGLTHGH